MSDESPTDREAMARLLGFPDLGGDVSPDRERRVKRAVLGEIRAVVRRRRIRRRASIGAGLLSLAAIAALAIRFAPVSERGAAPEVVATIERVEGDVRRVPRDGDASAAPISPSQTLAIGDVVETGATGGLSLRFSDASLRFDRRSQARLLSPRTVELTAGAVYFDGEQGFPGLEIMTLHGVVKDIGTQFEVRLYDDSLRVRVRSGIVEVRQKDEVLSAHAGTQLTIGPGGRSTRTVPPYGREWDWVTTLTPPFETNGRPLSAFLDHLCREHGWTLAYATPSLARHADSIVLHGSLGHLDATDALDAALSASGLSYRLERGELTIER